MSVPAPSEAYLPLVWSLGAVLWGITNLLNLEVISNAPSATTALTLYLTASVIAGKLAADIVQRADGAGFAVPGLTAFEALCRG